MSLMRAMQPRAISRNLASSPGITGLR